jgi:class 3 adenylate cyclase/predicted ATPase
MRFCGNCGAQLGERCAQCGFLNPSNFNFCGNCGVRLTFSAVSSEQLAVSSHSPSTLNPQPSTVTPSLLPPFTPSPIAEGERRRVTILFADVSGFTAMSEKMDPEEVFRLMNRCFERLGNVIERHEGTVDKFIGDSVMALFGAPIAHENDPERAVRAALDMQRELTDFAKELAEQAGVALRMRIGLNSGVVIAGAVGSDQKRQYTVMGDAVNLASRIESAAKPGGVLVTETIYRQTHRRFQFEAWEPIRVKGKEQPVPVYEVVGVKSVERETWGVERGSFVGRLAELQTLMDALDHAMTGKGRIVHVVGEAGIGKSRLLEESIQSIADRPTVCLRGECHAGESHIAYQMWRQILGQLCGIEDNDSEEQQKNKVAETLMAIDPDLSEWLPYLADVLGLPRAEGTDALTAKRVTQQAVRHVVLALAEKHGLVLIADDTQWADPLSLELLTLLMNDVPSSRWLFIAAQRPDSRLKFQNGVTLLNLKSLSQEECAQLVSTVLGADNVPPSLCNLIVVRSGGSPFFVVELIHALVETGALKREGQSVNGSTGQWVLTQDLGEIQLPETLEAVITARIDRLAPDVKRALQYAAVIGRQFPVPVLQKVTGLNGAMSSYLSQLENAEFIVEVSPPPLWEYGFQQALTQEVAYEMMLLQRRRQYHEYVARAMEEIYADRLDERAESLAYHYARSDNRAKAIEYLIQAGEKSLRLFATANAKAFFTDALSTLHQLPPHEREQWTNDEMRCLEALGDVATLTGDYAEALKQYQQVLDTEHATRHTPHATRIAVLKRKIGNVHTRRADFAEAVRWLREALSEVENGEGDESGREVAKIWSELAAVSFRLGYYAEAAEQAARGLEQAEWVNSRKEIGDCCLVLGVVQHSAGSYASADQHLRRSLQIREELGDVVGIASALNNLGNLASDRGNYREAEEFYRRSYEMRAKMAHNEGMSAALVNRGNVAFNLGKYADAERHYQQALDIAERIGNTHTATFARLNLGRSQLGQGKTERALMSLNVALSDAERAGVQDVLSLAHAELAMAHLAQSNNHEAEKHAAEALSIAESIGSKFHQAVALRAMGIVLTAQDQRTTAAERLRESLNLFEEMNAEHEIGRTCAELARVEPLTEVAATWRERAREIFQRLQAAGDLKRL